MLDALSVLLAQEQSFWAEVGPLWIVVGAVAIRLKEPVFESQTKNKLGNTEIRAQLVNQVRDVVTDQLHRNPKKAEKLLHKVEEILLLLPDHGIEWKIFSPNSEWVN